MDVFNIKFVGEIEKRPVIYNCTLQGYSRKDVTEKAWNEVAKEVNMTASECKEKWRNLRSTLAKNLKPNRSGSGAAKKKQYYLTDAMQFTIPFIKVLAGTTGTSSGNLPAVPQQTAHPSKTSADVPHEDTQQNDLSVDVFDSTIIKTDLQSNGSPCSPTLPPSAPILPPPPPQSGLLSSTATEILSAPESTETGPCGCKRKRHFEQTDEDKALANDFAVNISQMTNMSSPYHSSIRREGIQDFLKSLIPDLLPMTDAQLRLYKRKALLLIDQVIETSP